MDSRIAAEGPVQRVESVSVKSLRATIKAYSELMKPGILVLLLITGYCAMVVAAGGAPSIGLSLVTMVGLALSTGGAGAINMWYDRDIDAVMRRTQRRPIPSGRVSAKNALIFGIVTQVVSFLLLGLAANWLTAIVSLGGFIYYVFIYTMWLKRSTPQNIVIGGGAGAFPPLVGWAAVTGHIGLPAVIMFLIVFFWTPPHFWALALYKQDDYRKANIPMMPVVKGDRFTKTQSLMYAVVLLGTTVWLYFTGTVGMVYLVVSTLLGLGLIGFCILQFMEQKPKFLWARRTFFYSLAYLGVLFAAMVLDVHR